MGTTVVTFPSITTFCTAGKLSSLKYFVLRVCGLVTFSPYSFCTIDLLPSLAAFAKSSIPRLQGLFSTIEISMHSSMFWSAPFTRSLPIDTGLLFRVAAWRDRVIQSFSSCERSCCSSSVKFSPLVSTSLMISAQKECSVRSCKCGYKQCIRACTVLTMCTMLIRYNGDKNGLENDCAVRSRVSLKELLLHRQTMTISLKNYYYLTFTSQQANNACFRAKLC